MRHPLNLIGPVYSTFNSLQYRKKSDGTWEKNITLFNGGDNTH